MIGQLDLYRPNVSYSNFQVSTFVEISISQVVFFFFCHEFPIPDGAPYAMFVVVVRLWFSCVYIFSVFKVSKNLIFNTSLGKFLLFKRNYHYITE